MLKHFLWSLLGIADLDPLDSVDNPSVILAYFLYGVFLIMAVILLINMMIALLSNTYQQVAVRIELFTWSCLMANSLIKTRLQGIMVVAVIILNWILLS